MCKKMMSLNIICRVEIFTKFKFKMKRQHLLKEIFILGILIMRDNYS